MTQSSDPKNSFEKTANGLARSPLGIIVLFIVLVYSFATLITAFASSFTSNERLPLIWFLVLFPVLVFVVFTWLVVSHSSKLFGPGDFKKERYYLKLRKIDSTIAGIRKDVEKIAAAESAVSNVSLGEIHLSKERLADADAAFIRALNSDRGNEGALIGRAKVLRREEKFKEAIDILDMVIDKNPRSDRAYYNRACYKCLLKQEKEDVLKDLKEAIKILWENRSIARDDDDFKSLFDDPDFIKLVGVSS